MDCPKCETALVMKRNSALNGTVIEDTWYCNSCEMGTLDRSMPIIIGGLYQHQWSGRQWNLIAAGVMKDNEHATLCDTPVHELKETKFREVWVGSLDDFYKEWFFDEEKHDQYLRSIERKD
tara:strand:- start:2680 stop:3042 length:363 start_codon:yes stop_codon:yes gene_type:complete